MSTISVGAPGVRFQGVDDLSTLVVPPVTPPIPTYLPLIMHLAAKGPYAPTLVNASSGPLVYGEQTYAKNSPYYLHSSMQAKATLAQGGSYLGMRIRVPGAATAMLRLNLEIIQSDLHTQDGVTTITGYRLVWTSGVSMYPDEQQALGAGLPIPAYRNGNLHVFGQYLGRVTTEETISYAQSTLYPILDIPLDSDGLFGNNVGFEFSPVFSHQGFKDTPVIANSFLYNFKVMTRVSTKTQAINKPTATGAANLQFGFNPESTMVNQHKPYALPFQYTDNFISNGFNYGDINAPYMYQDNIDLILGQLWELESQYDDTIPSTYNPGWDLAPGMEKEYMLNFLTGKMYDGNTNYNTFTVDTAGTFGGISFAPGSFQWASGGADGLAVHPNGSQNKVASLFALDQGALNIMSNLDNPTWGLLDRLRNNFNAIVDTGYSLAVKDLIAAAHGLRDDIVVVLVPFRYADFVNGPELPTPGVNGRLTPTHPSDSGILGDNRTINRTPSISGTTTPSSTVSMVLNGKTYSALAGINGIWSISIPGGDALPNGTYTPALTITSPVGVVGTGNGTPFTVGDPPVVNGILTPVEGNDTDIIGDNVTSKTAPDVSGTTSPNSSIIVVINGKTYSTTSNNVGHWAITIPNGDALPSGIYTPVVTVMDSAGNSVTSNGTPFTIVVPITQYCVSNQTDAAIDLGNASLYSATLDGVVIGDNLNIAGLVAVLNANNMEAVAMLQTTYPCHVFTPEEIAGLITVGGADVRVSFESLNLDAGGAPVPRETVMTPYDIVITSNGVVATHRNLVIPVGDSRYGGWPAPLQLPIEGGILNVLGLNSGPGDFECNVYFWISQDYLNSNVGEVLVQLCPRQYASGDPDQGVTSVQGREDWLFYALPGQPGIQSVLTKLTQGASYTPPVYHPN